MVGTDQISTEHGAHERAGEEDAGSFGEFCSDSLAIFQEDYWIIFTYTLFCIPASKYRVDCWVESALCESDLFHPCEYRISSMVGQKTYQETTGVQLTGVLDGRSCEGDDNPKYYEL